MSYGLRFRKVTHLDKDKNVVGEAEYFSDSPEDALIQAALAPAGKTKFLQVNLDEKKCKKQSK